MKRRKNIDLENLILKSIKSAISRAKSVSTKIGILYVSRDFLNFFTKKNGYPPIMICGLFYEIDDNLIGIACYVEKLQ